MSAPRRAPSATGRRFPSALPTAGRAAVRAAVRAAGLAIAMGIVSCAPDPGPAEDETPAAFQSVELLATDYAFGVPATLAAGPAVFTLNNVGAVDHEVGIGLLREGVAFGELTEALNAGEDPEPLFSDFLGLLFADPGRVSGGGIYADLLAGRSYALVCFLQDEPDAPPHFALGMAAGFDVP